MTTVAQYASVVSEHTLDVQDAIQNSYNCVQVLSTCTLDAAFSIDTVAKSATSLALGLKSASNGNRPELVIGEPPAEIASLVDRTLAVADALAVARRSHSEEGCSADALGRPLGENCSDLKSNLGDAIQEFEKVLAAWQPYL